MEAPFLGIWQPLFQPYFPDWRRNLELPEREARDGSLIFRVSIGKGMWRRIAMPADATLDGLASWILKAVNFDSDHLYEFNYRDRLGADVSIFHPMMEEGPSTDEVTVGDLPLDTGQTMEFHFDFGDDWRFESQAGTDRAARRQGQEAPDLGESTARHPNNIRAGTSEPATSSTSRARKRLMGRKR